MLHWSIPLVAVPIFIALLLKFETIRSAIVGLCQFIYRSLNCVCSALAHFVDFMLRPSNHDGGVQNWRLAMWIFANAGAIVAIYHVEVLRQKFGFLVAGVALTLLHVLLVAAAIFKIAEENRIMHMGQQKSGALYSPRAAVRNISVIILEAVLAIASGTALLDALARTWPAAILLRTPDTGMSFVDYLLCLLSALPALGWLIAATDLANNVVFAPGGGTAARGVIYVVGSSVFYGAVTAWLFQRITINGLLSTLNDADSDDAHFVQLIISRAPPHIKGDLLAMALAPESPRTQLRAINTMRHLRVWTFPQTFLHQLDRFDRRIKIAGLNQVREFIASDGAGFADELLAIGIQKAFEQHISLSRTVADPVEDAVLSRLGALIGRFLDIMIDRGASLRVSKEQYGVLLFLAKTHKDDDARRAVAKALMIVGPKGFIMNYVLNIHERPLRDYDIAMIADLAAYVRENAADIHVSDLDTLGKRVNWSLRCGKFDEGVRRALTALRSAIVQSGNREVLRSTAIKDFKVPAQSQA